MLFASWFVSFRQKEDFVLYRAELQDEYAQLMQQYQAQGMSLEEATSQYYEAVFFPWWVFYYGKCVRST